MSTSPSFSAASRVAFVRDHLEDQAFDRRLFAPILVERFEDELYPGVERDEFVRAGADRGFLEGVVTDLLNISFGHDPAGPGRGRVEGQEVRPRVLQAEADMAGIRSFDRGDPRLQQIVGRTTIALERELHVLGRHRLAIVELRALAQHEIVAAPVFRGGHQLGEAWRQRLVGHGLYHRVV